MPASRAAGTATPGVTALTVMSGSAGPANTYLLTAVRLAGDQIPEMFGVGDSLFK